MQKRLTKIPLWRQLHGESRGYQIKAKIDLSAISYMDTLGYNSYVTTQSVFECWILLQTMAYTLNRPPVKRYGHPIRISRTGCRPLPTK